MVVDQKNYASPFLNRSNPNLMKSPVRAEPPVSHLIVYKMYTAREKCAETLPLEMALKATVYYGLWIS